MTRCTERPFTVWGMGLLLKTNTETGAVRNHNLCSSPWFIMIPPYWLQVVQHFTWTCRCWGTPASSCRNQGSSYKFPCRDTRWRVLGGNFQDTSRGKPMAGRSRLPRHPFAWRRWRLKKEIYMRNGEWEDAEIWENNLFTMTNEYPVQRDSQLLGHSGIWVVWLWTAMTLEVVSHTEHLKQAKTCIENIDKSQANVTMFGICMGNINCIYICVGSPLPPADVGG